MKRIAVIILCVVLFLPGVPAGASPIELEESWITIRLYTESGMCNEVLQKAESLGARVLVYLEDVNYLAVEVRETAIPLLAELESVLSCSTTGQAVAGQASATGRIVDRYDPLIQHNNLNAVGIPDLRGTTGATGQGVTIAIIDTGTDVSHPDLRVTPQGHRKIVDWKDFSGEGLVDTRRVAMARDGFIHTAHGQVKIGPVESRSGRYRYGVFREDQLDPYGTIGQDVNGNGSTRDAFIVVLVDSVRSGAYDKVIVDTNGNLDLTDEVALSLYSREGRHGSFGSSNRPQHLAFVVADIDSSGSYVSLGFDGNGHGTHVSGLAAAGGTRMTGAAPGARIMSLKALTSSGDGSWEDIARAMTYAAQNGAHVISISAGGVLSNASLDSPESLLMAELGRRYGVVFAVASGNDGPGLGTSSTPGHPDYAVTVGAYLSSSMWRSIYGHVVSGEGVWLFSAPGPRPDGSLAPDILAPGSAVSSVPTFYSSSGYAIMAGTSMSVPYVAGALALLRHAAAEAQVKPDVRAYKRSVTLGARSLPEVSRVEQGYGILDASSAWSNLKNAGPIPVIRPLVLDDGEYREGGFFHVSPEPAQVNLYIGSFTPWPIRLRLSSMEPWMNVSRTAITLPPVQERALSLRYDVPDVPGLYSGLITGDDPSTPGYDVAVLSTVIVPYQLNAENSWSTALSDVLPAARYRRYFFNVPYGADELVLSLRIIKGAKAEALGRAKFHVFQPDGNEVTSTGYVGQGQDVADESVTRRFSFPRPGVWEVVVESDPALSHYGRGDTYYQLRARASGILFEEPSITRWVPSDMAGGEVKVELKVTNNTDKPVEGRITGIGLSSADPFRESEFLTITEREAVMKQLPDVGQGTSWLRVWANDPSLTADLDLFIYRYDTTKKQWVEEASSAERGVSNEAVEIIAPQPGQYVAYVEAYGLGGSAASFEYGYVVLKDRGELISEDITSTRAARATWTTTMRMRVPSDNGTYHGDVLFETPDGYRSRLPVVLHVGKPEASISVRPGLIRPGILNQVTVEVTDPSTGKPAGTAVDVNGKIYHLASGKVIIPVMGGENGVDLVIRVVDGAWASVARTFQLGVSDGLAAVVGSPHEPLHRKVLDQMGE